MESFFIALVLTAAIFAGIAALAGIAYLWVGFIVRFLGTGTLSYIMSVWFPLVVAVFLLIWYSIGQS